MDPADGTYAFFAARLSPAVMAQLVSKAANPIAAVEALAVLLAFFVWDRRLRARTVLGFVDNEAAKQALVKGSSAAEDVAAIVGDICAAEIKDQSLCFWERVPSASNVADPPSRGVCPPALAGLSPPRRASAELDFDVSRAKHSCRLLGGLRDIVPLRPDSP